MQNNQKFMYSNKNTLNYEKFLQKHPQDSGKIEPITSSTNKILLIILSPALIKHTVGLDYDRTFQSPYHPQNLLDLCQ